MREKKPIRFIPMLTNLYSRITARKKKQIYLLLLMMIMTAIIQTLTLGLIAFFISSLSSPDRMLNSEYVVYIKNLIQIGIFNDPALFVVSISIAVSIFIVVKNICLALVKYASVRYSANIEAYFGDQLLQNFLHAEYIWYLKENPSDLINVVNWRTQVGVFLKAVLQMVTEVFFVVVVLCGLFILQPVVTLVVFGVLGSAGGIIYIQIRKRIDMESKKVRDMRRESFVESSKAVHGIKDVKISLKERHFSRLFSKQVYRLVRFIGRQEVLASAPTWFLESIGFFILMITIVAMLYLLKSTTAVVFSIISLIAVAAWKLLPALNRIGSSLARIRTSLPYLETIVTYLEEPEKEILHDAGNGRQKTIVFSKSVNLNGVSFSYSRNEEYALRNISCTIEKGQSIGVIGHSGAGKSTFVDVLIGLLKPAEGFITIDDRMLDEKIMVDWRSTIGYVPQFPYIYHGNLAENVAFGEREKDINRVQVLKVCDMASIDFLDKLDRGIDTTIGERGIRLSGGQRQRVAIARALYRNPEILIFDEATSSLDTKSEREIQKTIYSFKKTKTLVIIAHRLSTVENCDKLIWLENGRVVSIGRASDILYRYDREYGESAAGAEE